MAVGRYILTSTVTVAAGTVTPDALNGNGSGSTASATWAPLWAATFPKGQPIALDPAGKLYAAIVAAGGTLQLLTAAQETGGQAGVSN
jgi:hypothetical protein